MLCDDFLNHVLYYTKTAQLCKEPLNGKNESNFYLHSVPFRAILNIMVSTDKIRNFAQQIGHTFHPEKVLLFGSFARGGQTIDSDVDLLIVMNFTGKAHQIATQIRSKLRPDFPVDLLVRTPAQIRQRLDMGDCFIKEITQKGSVLYEAANT